MKSSHRTPARRLFALARATAIAVAAITGLHAQNTPPAPASPPSSTEAGDDDDDVVQLEPMEVTGSHIKRLDTETVSPVIQLNRAEIGRIGYPSIGEALRALPFNSGQALTPTDSGNSFTPGISAINLRGLGNNQALVLINGRRAVPYATPGFNGLQTVFDFNSLPYSAIEGIHILKDGGSAIYGSDAVTGVVNVIMRRDFQGLSVSGEIGNYYNVNGLVKRGSITAGNIDAKLSTFVTLDWTEQKGVPAREVKWAADSNKTSMAHKAGGRYTVDGFESAGFSSQEEYLAETMPLIGLSTDAIADGWFDTSSSRGFPGYVTVDGDAFTFESPTDTPTVDSAVAGTNLFNFQSQADLFPDYRAYGLYTQMRYDFTENLYGFMEFSFRRHESTPQAAATPVDIENENGLAEGEGMVLPAYNAFNPWGVDIVNGRRRLVELPTRINDVVSDTPRVVVGVGGNVGFLEGWTWESAVVYNRNSVTNLNRGAVSDAKMQQALMGLTRNGDGSLAWDPATPVEDRVYFNWFGNNETAFADFLEISNPTTDSLQYWIYDGKASGRITDLPAGPLTLAVGFEHSSQKLVHTQTDLNATGGIVGGSEGASSKGSRSQLSIYSELNIPVIRNVEVQLAARYEDYSDVGFTDEARPKIAIKARPVDWLVLRASYSESFKAPDLAYLYTASQTSFESFQVIDPVTGTEIDQVQIVTAGNPNLRPETADMWYVGAVFEAPERTFLKGLELSVEYFDLDRRDALAQLSEFYGYDDFFRGAAEGDPIFENKVVRDPQTNEVLFIRDDYTNISTDRQKGLDLGMRYTRVTDSWGTFTFTIDATRILTWELDGDEIAGAWLTPKWNGTGGISWNKGDWTVSVYEIAKGNTHRDLSFGTIYDEGDELFLSYDVKSQWITNLSVTYRGFEDMEVTVGATNLFNQDPPVDPFEAIGTTPGVNYAEPGFWYVRLERNF